MSEIEDGVEDWVVGCSGFWRKGEVIATRYNVPFRGTLEQVKARHEEMIVLVARQAKERDELVKRHSRERMAFWPNLWKPYV